MTAIPRRPRALSPADVRAPFGRYSHGILVPAGAELLVTSGQLGIGPDEVVPEDVTAQADLCFRAIAAILAEGGMSFGNVIRINAFVTRREDFQAYMAVRDRWIGEPPPASTLVVVGGFTRPEFKVEVEVTAARLP
jgi:enamine deaminase RidA (YjgF/YER057c/UK114 family)